MTNDTLHRFMIDDSDVRGEHVHLDSSWQQMMESTSYPAPVQRLLGEATAAAVLMAETIKLDGTLTLQAQGDGPVKLLVVQVTSERSFRATAKCETEVSEGPLAELLGHGQMVLNIEQGGAGQNYQGVVPLEGERLQDALGVYFERSEQLPTALWLSASDEAVAGLMLQKLPGHKTEGDEDLWPRMLKLADTVKPAELLDLSVQEMLHRLFHEEELRLFEGERLSFRCSCSTERIANTIVSLGQKEAESIVEEQGQIEVTCQFCQRAYRFDPVDVAALFSDDTAPGSEEVH
ncbi:MAG: Hsp33 family molecular chaperone HslO [Pseudomonadota bacterium]